MNGWVDLVRIEDCCIMISKELRHITGNITVIKRTGKGNEVMLGTQRGIYFAMIGKGLGILQVELERYDQFQALQYPKQQILDEEKSSFRVPKLTERAEATTVGGRLSDIEGMSQMTFHTMSQFGVRAEQQDDDAGSKSGSQTASVYTKPFTVNSNKASDKSKLQQSLASKPATEAPHKDKALMKMKDRKGSVKPEMVSD